MGSGGSSVKISPDEARQSFSFCRRLVSRCRPCLPVSSEHKGFVQGTSSPTFFEHNSPFPAQGCWIDILYDVTPCPGCQDGFSASPLTEACAASNVGVWCFAGRFSWQQHPQKDANNLQRGMKAALKSCRDLGVCSKRKNPHKPNPNQLVLELQSRKKSYFRAVAPSSWVLGELAWRFLCLHYFAVSASLWHGLAVFDPCSGARGRAVPVYLSWFG